jgi:hypothetical protein
MTVRPKTPYCPQRYGDTVTHSVAVGRR